MQSQEYLESEVDDAQVLMREQQEQERQVHYIYICIQLINTRVIDYFKYIFHKKIEIMFILSIFIYIFAFK